MRAVFILALVIALTRAALTFAPDHAMVGSGAALAFGFILLSAIQTGHIFHQLRLPHLTGFILCGALFGPEGLRLLTPEMVGDLALVKKVAVGLIAFIAGCELNFKVLLPRMRSIGLISLCALVSSFLCLFVFLLLCSGHLPFSAGLPLSQRAAMCLLCANVLAALSPSVVMGILAETQAAGPLSELCLAIVVLADLAIALSFSLSDSVAASILPGHGGHSGLRALAVHIVGSMVVGIGAGVILTLYIRRVGQRSGLFIFGLLFAVAEAGGALRLDPLLLGLTAGLFLENISPVSGKEMIRETEAATMPTFALFFAVIGAEIHLRAAVSVIGFGAGAALARAAGIYAGSRLGGRLAKVDPELNKLVPFGLFPQAGIAIALANLLGESFPGWGASARTLLLGTLMLNELVGPVLFRMALKRAGEIGKKPEPQLEAAGPLEAGVLPP